ncbi:DNA alkylation response protein [Prescottella equi]|uniref:acyl-CoA dehydrogenase family protein n=1 Tax=Rhodococcus hoagii TaxID=43767 RepID=UPI000A11F2A7|nr:acyl-CoA dehydrogenase family protein [Prescottella equi]ORL96982.1 DNA alkylation response protein [Prescottella equi]ORM18696.1 DNA alkylation response protein [Prescottella equi]QDP08653.1 DNA alkylation response protein [Prescottella equi]
MRVTHEVTNQVPPLIDYDAADYPPILEALQREGAHHALDEIHRVGRLAGGAEAQALGDLAEAHPPVLRTHDRYGNRIDEVEYDPAYHQLMDTAVELGLHGAPWADPRPQAHLIRAAKNAVWGQVDAGHGCPISMTYAVVPALRHDPELALQYEPLLTAKVYDPELRAPLTKPGLIAGMSMTEKQGGSDVRAGTTRSVPQPDGSYLLTGHKWFTSAPMSDIFLVLAQAPGGLTCFLLPRILPDGSRNAMFLQRLKDKLGNHSNASSEVEYDDAVAWRVGDEGRGVRTIIEMVNMTRLDCTIGTATGMRLGVAQAAHHAAHRSAFGAHLIDQPLMRNVLADLAVESEASTTVAMWLAALTDHADNGDPQASILRRVALAVSKYYVCKRGPAHAAEALECLGGNGYVEESRMPRLYREAPLLSVWEGSGNVAALDVLRAMARQPESVEAFFDELDASAGGDQRLDTAVEKLKGAFTDVASLEHRARSVVGEMALALQGALLVRYGHPAVADAFCASRLSGEWGTVFGTLPTGLDLASIIDRATPKVGS